MNEPPIVEKETELVDQEIEREKGLESEGENTREQIEVENKIFKNLHINISFVDAILPIFSYVKFLKDIMTRKRKPVDNEIIALTDEYST